MLFGWSVETWRQHYQLFWDTGALPQAIAWALDACEQDPDRARHALRPFTEACLRRAVSQGYPPSGQAQIRDKLLALNRTPLAALSPSPPRDLRRWALARTQLATIKTRPRLYLPAPRWNGIPMGLVRSCRSLTAAPRAPRDFADAVALVCDLFPLGDGWRELPREEARELLARALAGELVYGGPRMPEDHARSRSKNFIAQRTAGARFFTNHGPSSFGVLTVFTFSFGLAVVEPERATVVAIGGED